MFKKSLFLTCVLIFGAMLLFSMGGSSLEAQSSNASIKLKGYTFNPSNNESANVPPGLAIAELAAGANGYYLVQFAGPVQADWKQAVEAEGAELLNYVPDFAFKARMNPAQAARVSELASVGYVGLYQPAFKISPDLAQGEALFSIRVERGANAGQTQAAIARSGATVLGRDGQYITVGADRAQVEAIAHVTDVAWIENFDLKETHNESGAGVIIGGNTANANGYDGSTQTVAVADTGIGDGTVSGAHRDIPANRVVSVNNWPGITDVCFKTIYDDGAIDVDSAHGTHVSGSVLSAGDPSTGVGRGTAPAANLVFQATENYVSISKYCQRVAGYPSGGYFLTGLPANLNSLYQQAYDDGARVHANSWGSNQAGVYTANSAQTDEFVWNNPDMSITFSAGNDGADANNNGVVDDDSIGSPATAKNTITVGASENDRPDNFACDTGLSYTSYDAYQPGQTCNSMGGENILGTAGARWGFTTEPLNSDVTAGNQEQMAPFSSRGPTDDGRIKPDIVAPGTWILSTFSDLYQDHYDSQVDPRSGVAQYDGWGMPYDGFYKYMGGTSMSNPIAAGGAAVVRDYYNKAHSHNASAALVKATMINSAVDLLDENNDGQNDNDYPIPNSHEGWGRINIDKATDGSLLFVDDASGVATNGSANYLHAVSSANSVFKVSLVWSDYPSTEAALQNLVNDLDLVVTSPSGTVYRGNVFSNGWSQAGGNTDRVNNVENVYVQAAEAGVWSVTVSGYNVPNGPQPFAVVVDGTFGPPPPTATPAPPTATPPPPTATSVPPTATPAPPTATPAPSSDVHAGDMVGSSTAGSRNRWTASVTITVHDSSHNPVANATVNGAWSNGTNGSGSCVTNGSGQCMISKSNLKGNVGSVTLSVTSITGTGLSYNSGANDVSSVVVTKP